MSVFRLTRHTYQRLTQSGSFQNQISEESNASASRHGNETSQFFSEFDYRQNLHMECGVMALEAPPSYAIAMKELSHDDTDNTRQPRERGELTNWTQQREEGATRVPSAAQLGQQSIGGPPPYDDRGRNNRYGNVVASGGGSSSNEVAERRDSEIILLSSLTMSPQNQAAMGNGV